MAEIDLIPPDWRRRLQLRRRLRGFGLGYAALLLGLGAVALVLASQVRASRAEVEKLAAAEKLERNRQSRLDELGGEQRALQRRLDALLALRGGIAGHELLLAVDRALEADVWFKDWKLRRAGQRVEEAPEQTRHAGYLIVVPDGGKGREATWRVETEMSIRGQALDHSALAGFVGRLVRQPEIAAVRILSSSVRRYVDAEVVDFELAVTVGKRA